MTSILFECDGFHVKRNTFVLNTAAFTEFHKESVFIPFDSPFRLLFYDYQSFSIYEFPQRISNHTI